MKLLLSAETIEAGNELTVTLAELPAKTKAPTFTLTGTVADVATGEAIEGEALASSEPPAQEGSDWVAKVVPAMTGVLTLECVMVEGKAQETATATITVEPAPTLQEKLERALTSGDLATVRTMLGGAPWPPPAVTGGDAEAPAADDAEAPPEEAAPPEEEPAAAEEAAPPAEPPPVPEGGWAWEHSASGTPLIDLLASLSASEDEKLAMLELMLSCGATLPAKPLRRSAPPSALHHSIALKQPQLVPLVQ